MQKTAYFTMDLESFYDTSCIKDIEEIKEDKNNNHIEGLFNYLDLLNKYNVKGTFFINASRINEFKEALDAIIKEGHEIGLHCFEHIAPLKLSDEEFENQIKEGLKLIKEELDIDCLGYRAPCFGLDENKVEIVKKYFLYDSSILNYEKNNRIKMIDLKIDCEINDNLKKVDSLNEYMLNITKILGISFPISGGGYVRLLPQSVINIPIYKYIKRHNSYLFYAHPFEFVKYKRDEKTKEINKHLRFLDRLYLRRGRSDYLKKTEKIIVHLIKNGFLFRKMGDIDYSSIEKDN